MNFYAIINFLQNKIEISHFYLLFFYFYKNGHQKGWIISYKQILLNFLYLKH